MPPGPALLCDDGSEPARNAIRAAADLLGGGPALVVTVWQPYRPSLLSPLGGGVAVATGLAKEYDQVALELARKCAAGGVEVASAAGFDAAPLVVHGRPREAIVDAARDHGARVIVLGNRGQGGVESALYGSVSTAVLHHAPAPVLVVRESS
jgi:nucleotide-binding universal stress UspA family protein